MGNTCGGCKRFKLVRVTRVGCCETVDGAGVDCGSGLGGDEDVAEVLINGDARRHTGNENAEMLV